MSKLVKVREDETVSLVTQEEALKDWYTILDEPITLEELANYCDLEAEQDNRSNLVGTHRLLAALLHREVGRMTAQTILLRIAEYGGLHNMGDAFVELGIKDCWNDWKLKP